MTLAMFALAYLAVLRARLRVRQEMSPSTQQGLASLRTHAQKVHSAKGGHISSRSI
jgi:hypothetical protein